MCFGFVPIPLSVEEVVLEVCSYSSLCRGDCGGIWLSALSLLCRDDCCFGLVPYLLCWGGCVGERSCVLLILYLQIPRWRFPMLEVLCGHIENPSMWRRECRAVARTSKHIVLFAFDPLSLNSFSLSLSLSLLYLTLIHIVHITYMLDIVCVPILVLNQESFI